MDLFIQQQIPSTSNHHIEIVPTSFNPQYNNHIDRDRSYKQKFTEQRPVI